MMASLAMLLPIRIETRFCAAPSQTGLTRLCIRLVPDAISLVPQSPPIPDGDDAARREWRTEVRGIPHELEIVVTFDPSANVPPLRRTLRPDRAALQLPESGSDLLDAIEGGRRSDEPATTETAADGQPVPPGESPPGPAWWNSFMGARRAGLGLNVRLRPALASLIEAVYVVGVGTERPGEIFGGHVERGNLFHVRIGAPTNTVDGRPTASSAASGFSSAVTDPDDTVHDADTLDVDELVTGALWPALYGDTIEHVIGADPSTADEIARRGRRILRALGPYAPIRVGDVPYGVIPVSPLQGAVSDPTGALIGTAAASIRTEAARIARAGRAGTEPASAGEVLDRIAHEPVPRRFRHRRLASLAALPNVSSKRWDDSVAAAGIDRVAVLATRHLPQQLSRRVLLPVIPPESRELVELLASWMQAIESALTGTPFSEADFLPGQPPSLLLRLLQRSLRTSRVRYVNPPRAEEGQAGLEAGLELVRLLLANAIDLDALDRVTRAAVDAAGRRIDPWIVGLAWERWRIASVIEEPRVGVYGWVDRPCPREAPDGPEYLLAPSDHQALVAALARDRHASDPEPARWQLDLTSDVIRSATSIATEVRVGRHLSEVVGRVLEERAGSEVAIRWLRSNFKRRGSYGERRFCDGLRALRWITGDREDVAVPAADVVAALEQAAEGLPAALDAYADLLVLDGLHHVVSGRADLAKASLDAAAGLTEPPPLEVVRTPLRTRATTTTVLLGVPVSPATPGSTSALAVADPSLHAYLSNVAAASGAASWQLTLTTAEASGNSTDYASVAALGIDAGTAIALPPAVLLAGARAVVGAPRAAAVEPPSLVRARRLLQVLSGTTPTPETIVPATLADSALDDLRARLTVLLAVARDLRTQLPAGSEGVAGEVRSRLLGFAIAIEEQSAAAAELDRRIADAGAQLADLSLGTIPLAEAIARLAGFSHLTLSALVDVEAVDDLRTVPDGFVEDWLATVATVRPRIAHLDVEAIDPTLGPKMALAANHGADPWRRGGDPSDPMLVIAAPEGTITPASTRVAALVVDAFSETMPATRLDAALALHIDAPGARAPQAVLLVTGSDPSNPELTADTLLAAVRETRELAHARMVQLRDEPRAGVAVPLTIYPGADEEDGDVPGAVSFG